MQNIENRKKKTSFLKVYVENADLYLNISYDKVCI